MKEGEGEIKYTQYQLHLGKGGRMNSKTWYKIINIVEILSIEIILNPNSKREEATYSQSPLYF